MRKFCSNLSDALFNTDQGSALEQAEFWFGETVANFTNTTAGGHGDKTESNVTEKELKKSIIHTSDIFEWFVLEFFQTHFPRNGCRYTGDKLELEIWPVPSQRICIKHMKFEGGNVVKIPAKNHNVGSLILGVMYKRLHKLFMADTSKPKSTNQIRGINTRIISVTASPPPKLPLQKNISLIFKSLKPPGNKRECVFWNNSENNSSGWSGKGCYTQFARGSLETCLCNHMTHFAVLMDFASTLSPGEIDILNILTYVGLALSILGSLITIICYLLLTEKQAPLSQIRLSLVASLLAGQVIFLAGIDATENKSACVAVSALMQYFFMAALCWMLVEGIYLYMFIVKVYNVNHQIQVYHGMSWGIPAVLVAMSLGIAAGTHGVENFVNDQHCWLSSDNSLIWIFVLFAVVIEIVNVVILVLVIREIASLQHKKDKQIEQIRFGIRACVVLIPLLGVTWLFGLLLPLHKAFIYMFVILNSTQGLFIFALHCARNSEIRARFKRGLRTRGASTHFSKRQVRKTSQTQVTKSAVIEGDRHDAITFELRDY